MTTNHSPIHLCSFSGEPQLPKPLLIRLMFQLLEGMEKQGGKTCSTEISHHKCITIKTIAKAQIFQHGFFSAPSKGHKKIPLPYSSVDAKEPVTL